MRHHYLEEDSAGVLVLYDPSGQELERFWGQHALRNALAWAEGQGLELRSNRSPIDLWDNYRLYFRRRSRLKFSRYYSPVTADPPNVQRIVVPDDDEDDYFDFDESNWTYILPEDVELAPDEDD